MDRVEEFESGGTPGGTQTFLRPYLAGYSEFERTRRLDGSAGTQDPRSWITLRFGSRLLMDEPGCPPAFCSKGLPRRLLRTSL